MNDTVEPTCKDASLFNFEPQPDITAYELALIAKAIEFQITKGIVDRLPEETKRHFQRFVNVKKVNEAIDENEGETIIIHKNKKG